MDRRAGVPGWGPAGSVSHSSLPSGASFVAGRSPASISIVPVTYGAAVEPRRRCRVVRGSPPRHRARRPWPPLRRALCVDPERGRRQVSGSRFCGSSRTVGRRRRTFEGRGRSDAIAFAQASKAPWTTAASSTVPTQGPDGSDMQRDRRSRDVSQACEARTVDPSEPRNREVAEHEVGPGHARPRHRVYWRSPRAVVRVLDRRQRGEHRRGAASLSMIRLVLPQSTRAAPRSSPSSTASRRLPEAPAAIDVVTGA